MEITNKEILQHGLTKDEFKNIVSLIGRKPNLLELGIFSAMWNEHCSYKSSKKHLAKFPTKNSIVIQGPGENAGVIDIGENDAIAFKIESHNHPSFIEPYQGAATGVGGILRDVFTMGARPIANLNSLHFGDPKNKKTKNLLSGVVSGIGGYGNCVGIPTVGGETRFDESYNDNILVNAMTVGLVDKKKILYSKAKGINKSVIYVGSKTGRDGIHGASMASSEFNESTEEKKPTVQIGDPFTEKLLLEACLELMNENSIIAIQDMGAAGLTSSSVEMASKGNLGIEINLNKIPCRETNMSPYEMMLSESQERMLIILEEGKEDGAKKIFEKWGLDFSVIGKTTNTKKIILIYNDEEVANLSLEALSNKAPVYNRKWKKNKLPIISKNLKKNNNFKIYDSLLKILSLPNVCNKKAIWEQYDHTIMCNTVQKPGGDAAVVKINNKNKAIAMTVDSSPHFCEAFPLRGGKQVVCETWRNLISVGSKPLAITNCLNFGNPEKEDSMGQFVECVEGIAEACKYLDYPVISGNVSFYNETKNKGIKPTPTIGGVGIIKDLSKIVTHKLKGENNNLLVIGKTEGHLDQSIFYREILKFKKGPPPEVNLFNEKNNGLTMLELIDKKLILSAHDISIGGIIVTISEMCIGGNIGAKVYSPTKLVNLFEYFFGEDQGRYIIEVSEKNIKETNLILEKNGVFSEIIGKTQKNHLELENVFKAEVEVLKKINSEWLENYI